MPMPSYRIGCQSEECGKTAEYKIAANWSDGMRGELKTFALCCRDCLPQWYADSIAKQKSCRLAKRETIDRPGVYQLQSGQRDQQLQRMEELERELQET